MSASSVLRHVEDVVLATSGADAFEIVFAVAAARIAGGADAPPRATPSRSPRALRRGIAEVARRHPILEVARSLEASDALLDQVDGIMARALDGPAAASTLDAVFESLVPRVSKADKGQYFTPRHVVDFVIRMLAPAASEVVVDPSCGSGAFLTRARTHAARVDAHGCDTDARAVRVARLLALASAGDPAAVRRADGLRGRGFPVADVVATNPPFAGRAPAEGFAIASVIRTPERDALFLERALDLLRPGGRLGIVLPYNKASGQAFAALRRWVVDRARILAIVGLPRETFLPHTAQRTFILFAQKRASKRAARPLQDERTMLVVSERAGKDSGGEPILRDGRLDHDLDEVGATLGPFLRAEAFG